MKNIIKYLFLAVLFVLTNEVYAQIKIDASNAVSNVTDKVTATSEDINAKMKGVADTKKGLKFIDAAKEGIKKAKELKKQAEDTMKAAQDLQNSAEGNLDSLKDGVAQGAFNVAASNASVLSNLQVQQAQAKAEYEAAVKGYEATRNSTVNKHKENIKIYEKMKADASGDEEKIKSYNAKINEANQAIQKANEDCEAKKEKARADFEKKNSKYENQINSLKAAAGNTDPLATDNLSGKATDATKSLSGGGKNALNASIAGNFYEEDEEESIERNRQINNYRKKVEFEDTLESYYQAIKFMSEGDSSKDIAEDLRSETQNTETVASGPMLDISILIEQMRSMLKYARMQVASLKMMTARDMVKMPKHLSEYSTLMESNLDVYKKVGKGKLGKSKISLNDVKNTYNSAKSGISEAKSNYDEAKEVAGAAGELAGAVGSFGSSTSERSDGGSSQSAPVQESEAEVSSTQSSNNSEQTGNVQNVPTSSGTANAPSNARMMTTGNQREVSANAVAQPSAMAAAVSKNSGQAYSSAVSPVPQSSRQAFSSTTTTERQDVMQDKDIQSEVSEKAAVITNEMKSSLKEVSLTEENKSEIESKKNEIKQEGFGKQDIQGLSSVSKEQPETSGVSTVGRKAFSLPDQKQEISVSADSKVEMAIKQQEKGQ